MPSPADVDLIIPFRANPERDRIVAWTLRRYAELIPDLNLVLSEQNDPTEEFFRRSEAINNGVRNTNRPIILIADADVAVGPQQLGEAAKLVVNAPWVIPYDRYHELTQDSTEWVLENPRHRFRAGALNMQGTYHNSNASLVMITRDNFERSGWFDERFISWGPEDQCWAAAVTTLCGPPERIYSNDLFHLWHPVNVKHTTSNPHYAAGCELWDKYKRVTGNKGGMRALVAGNHD